MTHDSRCSLAEPCLTAMPTHDCCNNHENCTSCGTESGAACFTCGNTCQCDLITKVRADERSRCHTRHWSVDYQHGYEAGRADERKQAAERIAAIEPVGEPFDGGYHDGYRDALDHAEQAVTA